MNPDYSSAPPPETKSQRLFFALWPPLELSRELYGVAGRVQEDEARRVPPENIHLTLAFLGSVKASFRQCAEQVAAAIRTGSFTLTLEQIGCWPKPGILWIGPRHTPEPLSRLVRELNAGLPACGYVPEERSYAAHLTLARKLRRCNKNLPIDPLIWEVRRFCLVQSHTHADGARYEIIRSWELNSAER
ncbi:MAG: RNA 2',3'-cyclic phosphodiesterase [Sulfuricaulis sp.]|uniref:RNA 2',3'-cyclic phosphodiesterase n=1 Tax=Sulfuricaulis sp. TaxID=2003553 RepID=UPI003C6B51FE